MADRNAGVTRRDLTIAAAAGAAFSLGAAPGAMGAAQDRAAEPSATMLDVRSFGAKGDGKADDTAAIQAALDKAAEIGGGVFVPPGTYLSGEIQMREHGSLIGVPTYSYRSPGGTIMKLNDPKAKCLINITGAFGCTLDGLCLMGDQLGEGTSGILLDKSDYGRQEDAFRVERCLVSRFTGDGLALIRVWCFSVRHSMIAHNGGHGINMRGWDGFILDNWLSGNHGAGFAALSDDDAAVTLTANRIEWNQAGGIVAMGATQYNINGNYIDRCGGAGILISSGGRANNLCQHISVTGNVVNRSGKWAKSGPDGSCHIYLEGGRGLSIIGNAMTAGQDDGNAGAWSPLNGIVVKDVSESVIKDNTLYDGAVEKLFVDLGGVTETAIIKDNPGSVHKAPEKPPAQK
jgi:hypothetical protein